MSHVESLVVSCCLTVFCYLQAVKPPAKFKRKTVYFVKTQKSSLNAENIKKNVRCNYPILNYVLPLIGLCLTCARAWGVLQVTYGDFAESPIETLSALSQEVVLPVLSNPANRTGWPDVVSKEVTENLHKFIANGMLI